MNYNKGNIRYRITYILLALIFLIGAIFYRQSFLAILLILICILPVLSIFMTLEFASKITVTAISKITTLTVGNKLPVTISIHNPSFFPFLNCEIELEIDNLYYPGSKRHILALSALPKKKNACTLSLDISHVGIMSISITGFTVTDPLHLYTMYSPTGQTIEIPIMPEEEEKQYPLFLSSFLDNEDDEYMNFYGQPSRDLKEIRDYIPGDKLTDIHWKLSAARDELLVKEYEQSASRTMVIMPELNIAYLDDTLQTTWSYMKYLLKHNEIFKLAVYNHLDNTVSLRLITNEDDAREGLLKLFYCVSYSVKDAAYDAFRLFYDDDNHVLVIEGQDITEK